MCQGESQLDGKMYSKLLGHFFVDLKNYLHRRNFSFKTLVDTKCVSEGMPIKLNILLIYQAFIISCVLFSKCQTLLVSFQGDSHWKLHFANDQATRVRQFQNFT